MILMSRGADEEPLATLSESQSLVLSSSTISSYTLFQSLTCATFLMRRPDESLSPSSSSTPSV